MTKETDFSIENLKIDGKTFRASDNGQRVEVKTLDMKPRRKPRKPFKPLYVQLPMWWIENLPQASRSAILLAHAVLVEEFKRKYIGGDIVLSATVTGIPRNTRTRAIKELVGLGLIEIEQDGKQAARVRYLYKEKGKEKKG